MARPVMICCAVTGSAPTPPMNPAVPVTPEEIANEAIAAGKAGAAVAHIHVRDPETGKPSTEFEHYKEVTERIRDSGSPILINLTTGPGARFSPSENDPMQPGPGSDMRTAQERVSHVQALKPDLCSLDIATLNFNDRPMVSSIPILTRMAELIQAAGVKPELEVFDTGHARLARHMCEEGIIDDNYPLFQLCLGISWGAEASPESMMLMRDLLPANATWQAFGISRHEFPMVAAATLLGGNVRVGMEDNIYISRGELANGNAVLVERAAEIIESVGERVATPEEAREMLHLPAAA